MADTVFCIVLQEQWQPVVAAFFVSIGIVDCQFTWNDGESVPTVELDGTVWVPINEGDNPLALYVWHCSTSVAKQPQQQF